MSGRSVPRPRAATVARIALLASVALSACTEPGTRTVATKSTSATPGNERTPMKYSKIEPANAMGYAKVSLRIAEQYAEGVIDKNGVEIIAPNTELLVSDITDARALLQFASKFLFVDLDQGPVDASLFATTPGFTFAEPFRSGLALVKVGEEQFYIDTMGGRPLKETYDHAETFHSDRALVVNGNRKRIIDPQGRTVAVLTYDQVNPYSALRWQVTRVKQGVFVSGFVDLNGKEVVPLIYDDVGYFQEDVKRTIVGRKGTKGFVDEAGSVVIPLQYDYAEIFDKGKARVRLNGRFFFIDPNGKEVPDE